MHSHSIFTYVLWRNSEELLHEQGRSRFRARTHSSSLTRLGRFENFESCQCPRGSNRILDYIRISNTRTLLRCIRCKGTVGMLRALVIQGGKVIDEGATGADYGIVSLSGSCGLEWVWLLKQFRWEKFTSCWLAGAFQVTSCSTFMYFQFIHF